MHCYPVHFRAGGTVGTDDFGAVTFISGRMLIQIGEDEQTEIWTTNPAGVHVEAPSLDDAVIAAVDELGRGLTVLAQDSGSYAEFEVRSKRLVERQLASLEKRWADACAAVAELPDRAEFVRLTETPEVEIASRLVYERPPLRPGLLQMTLGDLQVERQRVDWQTA